MRRSWRTRALRRLARATDGAVAPTVALSLVGLIAAGGIAFDYARVASMDTELQNAADQAALAAASQLDGAVDSMVRAEAGARSLLANQTLMANDGASSAVTVDDWEAADPDDPDAEDPGPSPIVFYDSRSDAEAGTDEFTSADTARAAQAKFVRVRVAAREAVYALTPIVGAFRSGAIGAEAVAGLGSAICKVPPLMICNPTPGTLFNAALWRGRGIKAVSRGAGGGGGGGSAWTPGGFGYLGPGDTPSTQEGLAFEDPVFSCQSIDSGNVDTGNPVPAITAVNTRFDIYDYGSGGGITLAPCLGGACPAAVNVTKGLVHTQGLTSTNECKLNSSGWRPPVNGFAPGPYDATKGPLDPIDPNGVDAMGLPRDNCHYGYGTTCDKFGDGVWARGDYWNKYHPAASEVRPGDWATKTRYETYRWEIDNNHIPGSPGHANTPVGGLQQYGKAICNSHDPDPARDRRVFVVAIGENCAALHGSSTPVEIGSWVEMFFVEPAVRVGSGGAQHGEIYLEVIGPAAVGGSAQVIRRDVPYLVR